VQGLPKKLGGPGQIFNSGPLFPPKKVGLAGVGKRFSGHSQKQKVPKNFRDKHQLSKGQKQFFRTNEKRRTT
jgi:hypothetical protein